MIYRNARLSLHLACLAITLITSDALGQSLIPVGTLGVRFEPRAVKGVRTH